MNTSENTSAAEAENKIISGVIWKQLMLFFFPIVLGTFFQQIYNTADAVVVGRFVGKEALASVGGSTSQIINLIVGFFVGLSSGATVVLSQFYGARDAQNVSHAMHTAAAFSIAGSLVITVLGVIFAPSLLSLMNTPQNIMADSTLYLRVYFSGIIFVFIYNIGSGILRAVGDSKRPLYFLIICCMINIVLDLVLVLFFKMGVAGVAIATLISQAVSAVLIVITLMRSTDLFRLVPRQIRFHKKVLLRLLAIGLPAGLQSVMYTLSNMTIQTSLNGFGTDTVAAWTAFGKMDAFFWMICSAFGISITTFVGQNFGAGKIDRMKKSVRICLSIAVTTAVAMSALFFVFGKYVFRLFTTDASVIAICIQMMVMMVPGYAIYVFIEILSGALRGRGDVLIPMLMTCFGICIFRVIWVVAVVPLHRELNTIIISYPVSWIITAACFIVYYLVRQRQFDKQEAKLPGN